MGELIMNKKPLMMIDDSTMHNLHISASAGMNFHIVETADGLFVISQSGEAMPLFEHSESYCLSDCLNGTPIPLEKTSPQSMSMMKNHSGRHAAMQALNHANISSSFMGLAGASPLIGTTTLEKDTVFYRFISSETDHRYVDGKLTASTYVTTSNDAVHVNSGFSVVARYALPLPLPANHRIEYKIPKGTMIQVGTVAPNFGQAGGGVEVFLLDTTLATQISIRDIPDF